MSLITFHPAREEAIRLFKELPKHAFAQIKETPMISLTKHHYAEEIDVLAQSLIASGRSAFGLDDKTSIAIKDHILLHKPEGVLANSLNATAMAGYPIKQLITHHGDKSLFYVAAYYAMHEDVYQRATQIRESGQAIGEGAHEHGED